MCDRWIAMASATGLERHQKHLQPCFGPLQLDSLARALSVFILFYSVNRSPAECGHGGRRDLKVSAPNNGRGAGVHRSSVRAVPAAPRAAFLGAPATGSRAGALEVCFL